MDNMFDGTVRYFMWTHQILVFLRLLAMRLIYHTLHLKSTPDTKDYYTIKLLQKEFTVAGA